MRIYGCAQSKHWCQHYSRLRVPNRLEHEAVHDDPGNAAGRLGPAGTGRAGKTLPADFALADPTAANEITIRHLLTHTSGIQGDYFKGFGRGDEAVERYVASLADVDLVHRPGQLWSYCNSGYVVAGRVAEVIAATPYNQLLKEKICHPLGWRRPRSYPRRRSPTGAR